MSSSRYPLLVYLPHSWMIGNYVLQHRGWIATFIPDPDQLKLNVWWLCSNVFMVCDDGSSASAGLVAL